MAAPNLVLPCQCGEGEAVLSFDIIEDLPIMSIKRCMCDSYDLNIGQGFLDILFAANVLTNDVGYPLGVIGSN